MHKWKMLVRKIAIRLGVCAGLLLATIGSAIYTWYDEPIMDVLGLPDSPARAVNRQLKWADYVCEYRLNDPVPICNFFSSAYDRTHRYSEEVLGFESKWTLVTDYVTGGNGHSRYLKDRFEATVFSQSDLDAVIEEYVLSCLRKLDDIEAEMLVRLEADLSKLPNEAFTATLDRQALSQTFEDALKDAADSAHGDLKAAVGRELASWIAGEILAHATIQLATSSGILSTGAASGTVTFGVGLVVGLIVDAIINEIYNQMYDPVGELEKQLNAHLTKLERLILNGTPDSPGLEKRMAEYAARRSESRRAALTKALLTLSP